ncbi:MAG: hypothetical protein U0163_04340 [Gemmatimonadaceae bacterium]
MAWFWVAIELVNGMGHPLWAIRQGGYVPGVLTAPLLLVLAVMVGRHLPYAGPLYVPRPNARSVEERCP